MVHGCIQPVIPITGLEKVVLLPSSNQSAEMHSH